MITLDDTTYIIDFRYDPVMVAQIKNTIPATGRKWDGDNKVWEVAAQYRDELVAIFPMTHVPPKPSLSANSKLHIFDVRYIGRTKERGDGFSSFGFYNDEWSVIFPEDVLRQWFDGGIEVGQPLPSGNHYSVLGIKQSATPEQIKTGYRRMVKQWHPDVCKEANANDVFLKIQNAYQVLSDDRMKARYNAGLLFASTVEQPQSAGGGYAPPLRCGMILADATQSLGRYIVTKIIQWEDITDRHGNTLVSSWVYGDTKHTEQWV